MAKTKDMPSNVIKAGAELSKVAPGPSILQKNHVTWTLGAQNHWISIMSRGRSGLRPFGSASCPRKLANRP